MTSRPLPPLFLHRSPLVLALAQVRFSPVLQMETFLPQIQERLRGTYPGFRETTSQEVLLSPEDGSIASRKRTRWLFVDQGERQAVVLTPDFVVLQTSQYSTFDAFAEQLHEILGVVHEAARIGFSERVGLRYVDRIVPNSDEKITDYVYGGLAGLPSTHLSAHGLQVSPTLGHYEVRAKTHMGGNLVIRTFERPGDDIRMPPGLEEQDIQLPLKPSGRNTLLLDIDHFVHGRHSFDPGGLMDTAWKLHDYADLAFRQSTTEHAMNAWGKNEAG